METYVEQSKPFAGSKHKRSAWQRALIYGTITLFGVIVMCFVAYSHHNNDILTFSWIGTYFSDHNPHGSIGYDGQFAYFIARDGAQAIPFLDGPSLRYQRILYPILSRALAFGSPDLVPWTLVIINIVAHAAATGLIAYLLATCGANPAWSLIYATWIGAIFALRLNLNEPLYIALSLVAITTYIHRSYRWTIFALILATLSKELGLIFAAGLAFHAFFNGQRKWSILLLGGPLLAFLSWWGILKLWFGVLPTIYPAAKIHPVPFNGLFYVLGKGDVINFVFITLWLGIPTVILFGLAIYTIWKTKKVSLVAALMLFGAGFVMFMPGVSWEDPVAAYRVASSLTVTGLLFVATFYPKRLIWLAALWVPSLLMGLMVPFFW